MAKNSSAHRLSKKGGGYLGLFQPGQGERGAKGKVSNTLLGVRKRKWEGTAIATLQLKKGEGKGNGEKGRGVKGWRVLLELKN